MSDVVLVTGAGGCIGSWALKQLNDDGKKVVAFDLKKDTRRAELIMEPDALKTIAWEQGDIADQDRFLSVLNQHQVTAIIHLAALQVPFCKADPRTGARVNVLGTVNVFEAARELGIKRLAYASSVAAHSVHDDSWLNTLYGVYKHCDENLAQVYWQDWQVGSIGIRPNIVYGPARDQGMSSLPTLAMLAAVLEQPYQLPFTGTLGFLYAAEAAAGFISAIQQECTEAPVYDFNGTAQTVDTCLDIIKQHCPNAELVCSGDPLPFPGDLDDSPIRRELSPFRAWSLEEGIAETIGSFRKLVATGKLDVSHLTPGSG